MESTPSKKHLIVGRALSTIAVTILLLDALGKILQVPQIIKVYVRVQYPLEIVPSLGILLLICLLLHVIPRTKVLGAILITGYLGGAVAVHLRVSSPVFSYTLVPVYIGILIWTGIFLRDPDLKKILFKSKM